MTLISQDADSKTQGRLSDRVCVSIYGRSILELGKNVKRALAFDPGFVEIRLDYLPAITEKIQELAQMDNPGNLIQTYRSNREGGISRVSDENRRRILLELISKTNPAIMDIEIETLESFPDVANSVSRRLTSMGNLGLIASSHNFQKTEEREILEKLVLDAAKKYAPKIVKVVRHANQFSDNLVLLSLYRLREKIHPTELIAFCTGSLGIFSRISCVTYGSPFTFASLPDRRTAPGQLDIKAMKTLLDSWTVVRK